MQDSVEGSSPDSAPPAKSTEEELQHQKQEKELFVADHRDEDSMTDEQQVRSCFDVWTMSYLSTNVSMITVKSPIVVLHMNRMCAQCTRAQYYNSG